MGTKLKRVETQVVQALPEETVDNRLEFLKGLSNIGSRLNTRISNDWVMAKLGDKDKEAIREMIANAYYGDNLLKEIALKHQNWTWNKKEQYWKKEYLDEKQKKAIINQANKMFDTFTVRVETTIILSRNVKNNWLVRLMAGASEEEQEYEPTPDEETKTEKATKLLKREKNA